MAIPPVWESDGGVGPVEMPPDETIEVMAQAIHEHYLTEQAEQTNLPALRPWAELDERFRAQNRDQARDNILKLHSLGLKVVAAGLLSVDAVRLGEADIERLGIAEHDRWSHQKREQGYRFGPELILEGADLRHPSLLPWDELPASEKEKDVAPIRQIPAVLAAAGLAITR
ncbi:MAG: RyR domain protein [Candidatus Microthrix parvicella]|nr:RyR domain protein [Candidatus Microthrix parvicella]